MTFRLFYLAITETGETQLFKNLETLAEAALPDLDHVLSVPIDFAVSRGVNHTAAEYMLDLFNAQEEVDIAAAPDFALKYLQRRFEESAAHNAAEAERVHQEALEHERQELSNLHTL